ncbi:MAG: family 78 glycoside hydrolase catalytic domain, partial [Pseudomonadota bacterium]|nr:family 78 glycoside hydrolase catalytic domain [Pseudomonadota bacterium]
MTDDAWTGGQLVGNVRGTAFGRTLILRRENASPAFEKTFRVKPGLLRATLHVTAPGFYEAQLDGRKIGTKVLDPSPTDYTKRVLYSTYRLEKDLPVGDHALRLLLGHGWYDMRSLSVWNFREAPWRDAPCTRAQLELDYADGTRAVVATDGTWRQVKSPVVYDDIREGELYGEWERCGPDFAAQEIYAREVAGPTGRLAAEAQPGAEVRRTLPPSFIRPQGGGAWLIGFAENLSGWIRLKVRGAKRGDGIRICYTQSPNGHGGTDSMMRHGASQDFLPFALGFQTDFLVASGAPVETFEPRFSYKGFQYVQVNGLREAPRTEDVEACVVATAFPDAGEFACSDTNFTETVR